MTVKIKEIMEIMEKVMPAGIAFDWDNNGLCLGNEEKEVEKVMLALDITSEVIAEAVEKDVGLIIVHHPILFEKINKINFETLTGRHIIELLSNDIAVISAHTNCDFSPMGLNMYLATLLGLIDIERYGDGELRDMLTVGCLPQNFASEELIDKVKDRLDIKTLRIIGCCPKIVKKVAVFTGKIDISVLLREKGNYDVVVCGETKYAEALTLRDEGIFVIEAGHNATERIFVYLLDNLIKSNFFGLQVVLSDNRFDPYRYIS